MYTITIPQAQIKAFAIVMPMRGMDATQTAVNNALAWIRTPATATAKAA